MAVLCQECMGVVTMAMLGKDRATHLRDALATRG
jgi:hypothetical protein